MKIRIALVPNEHICKAEALSIKLQDAVEAGEMKASDLVTDDLLSIADQEWTLSLAEEGWHQLIEKVRSTDGDFKSDYLMSKPQLQTIIAAGIGELFANVADLIDQALRADGVVLQLPTWEEDDDV